MIDLLFETSLDSGELDLVLNSSEIQTDETLRSAILVSLFTDARVEKSELPQGETSQRGYFGDVLASENTGSKLWLLNRAKQSTQTLLCAQNYAKDALSWLVLDGLAKDVVVNTSYQNKKLQIDVTVIQNKENKVTFSFSDFGHA